MKKPSYSLTEIVRCPTCGHRFSITGRGPIFRSCDAYVCSPECSYLRAQSIATIDKNLNNPMSWPMQRSSSSANVNKPPKPTTWRIPEETPLMMGLEDYNSIEIHNSTELPNHVENIEEKRNIVFPIACIIVLALSAIALM